MIRRNYFLLIEMLFLGALGLAMGCDNSASGSSDSRALPDADDSAVGDASADRTRDVRAPDAYPALGQLTVLSESCEAGPLPNTQCKKVEITCSDRPTIRADIRISSPENPAAITLLWGTGGTGTTFADEDEPALPLLTAALAARYRLVQRRWDEPGWMTGASGLRATSCAYATLLHWVKNEYATDTELCALGSSGGALELAYGVTHWNGAEHLVGAVLLGGPTVPRLDLFCPSRPKDTWETETCPQLAQDHDLQCGDEFRCVLSEQGSGVVDSAFGDIAGPCTSHFQEELLLQDSLLPVDGKLDYGAGLPLYIAAGAEECLAGVLLFASAIESTLTFALVPNTGHRLFDTDEGQEEILKALSSTCALLD